MPLKSIDGKPIVNATESITLVVNGSDVARSDHQESANCAVARACRRQLHAREVRIHLSRAYIRSNESNWVRYDVPRSMRAEIVAFDRGGRFSPGTWVLTPPRRPATGQRQGTEGHFPSQRNPNRKVLKVVQKRRILKDVRQGPAA